MNKFTESTIVAALDEYKERVSEQNLIAAKRFVDYATTQPIPTFVLAESDNAGELPINLAQKAPTRQELENTRLDWCLGVLLYDADFDGGFSKPQDIITNWNAFASHTGLNGAAVRGTPEERNKRWDDIVRGLRDGLQALGDAAAELDIPGDFAIMLKHADTLEGHKWGKEKVEERACIFFRGFKDYDSAKSSVYAGEDLNGAPALAWRSIDYPEYDEFADVVAGFETGYEPEGGCFMIYGRRMVEEEFKWFYYVNQGQYGVETFESLVDFLEWYQEFGIANETDIERTLHGLWRMGGPSIA